MVFEKSYIDKIKKICQEYGVKSLAVFGSVVTGKISPDSDIDFIVEIGEENPFRYTDYYFGLKEKLEDLFNRSVDIIESRASHNPNFLKEIDQNKIVIYGESN